MASLSEVRAALESAGIACRNMIPVMLSCSYCGNRSDTLDIRVRNVEIDEFNNPIWGAYKRTEERGPALIDISYWINRHRECQAVAEKARVLSGWID